MKHDPASPGRALWQLNPTPALLSTFIADEDEALRTERQRQFWPMKRYLITAAIPKADRHLEPASRQPDPDRQWSIRLTFGGGRIFSEKHGQVLQNDIRINGLGAANLLNMPQWINRIELQLGVQFDRKRMVVRCGRNKATAKLVTQWLAG